MKISKLFHWLYATLMFLPLLVAPIFGIYSHRHTLDSYSVVVPQNKIVDFNQQINFLETDFWDKVESYDINIIEYSYNNYLTAVENLIIPSGHKFIYRASITENNYYRTATVGDLPYLDYGDLYVGYENILTSTGLNSGIILVNQNSDSENYVTCSFKANIIDLTQMYGEGNEPTLQEFKQIYSEDYYSYTLSKKEVLQIGTITYDNTDIGSQFVYTIHNTIQSYFNMSDLFAFKGLSSWIQVAFFDGNFTLGFYIFYNLLLYWFVVSLLWLIFDVLMYVPNLAHKWLDRSSLQ